MANIISYLWEFSNGVVSREASPIVTFIPGRYDVTLTVETDDDDVLTITKTDYIVVTEDNQNLLKVDYLNTPSAISERASCYHYGMNQSTANGWSRVSGEHWVWPEAQASISHEVRNGIDYLLVWDMYDDYQYCINPRNTIDTPITHLDKGLYPIECSVTLTGVTGERRSFDIMHQETLLHFRKDIDTGTIPADLEITTSLIGSDGTVLEEKTVPVDTEVVFKEQSVYNYGEHKVVQIKVETNKSGFNLSGIDSNYKVDDKLKITATGQEGDTAAIMADASFWLSYKEDYETDLVSGDSFTFSRIYEVGPDGRDGSSIFSYDVIYLQNEELENCTLSFWSTSEPNIGVELVTIKTIGGWKLYAFSGTVPQDIELPNGSYYYDIRIINSVVSLDTLNDYANNLKLHVVR